MNTLLNKTILMIAGVAVVVGVVSFYGGIKYAQSTRLGFARQNLSPEERQQRLGQMGANIGFRAGMGGWESWWRFNGGRNHLKG